MGCERLKSKLILLRQILLDTSSFSRICIFLLHSYLLYWCSYLWRYRSLDWRLSCCHLCLAVLYCTPHNQSSEDWYGSCHLIVWTWGKIPTQNGCVFVLKCLTRYMHAHNIVHIKKELINKTHCSIFNWFAAIFNYSTTWPHTVCTTCTC